MFSRNYKQIKNERGLEKVEREKEWKKGREKIKKREREIGKKEKKGRIEK